MAQAVGTGSGPSANDGLGDAGTNPYSGSSFNISQGTHYVAMAGTNIITIKVSPSVTFSGSGTGTVGYILSVTPLNQTGSITSTLGGTCHKGSDGSQVNDGVDSSGTFQATTVMPLITSPSSITYTGSSIGNWSAGSTYALSLTSNSATSSTDTFIGAKTLAQITGKYQNDPTKTYGSSPSNLTDTVTLALNDGSDSVSETVLYVTTFHKGAENEFITSGPTKVGWDSANVVQAGSVDNYTNTAMIKPYSFSNVPIPHNTTITTSPSSQQAVEALSYFFNIQPLGVYTNTYTVSGSVMVPANSSVSISAYVPIDDENGTCDIYSTNGYQGIGTFDVHLPEANAQSIPPSL
jgi:hypothetical protein